MRRHTALYDVYTPPLLAIRQESSTDDFGPASDAASDAAAAA